jgi:hypothetical protein
MIIKNSHQIRTYECPCGWTTSHVFTRESELKITERLHAKVCSRAKNSADTDWSVSQKIVKIKM